MSFAMKEKFVDKLIRYEETKIKSPMDMWQDFSILEAIPPTDGCYMVMLAEAMAIDRLFWVSFKRGFPKLRRSPAESRSLKKCKKIVSHRG